MKQISMMKTDRTGDFASASGGMNAGGRINLFPAQPSEDAAQKIGRCVAFMERNVTRPLQVATLAAQASLSPSHFFALFKQHTGCPPMDYFTRLRMRRACELFDSTSASVKEVAAMMGYDDPFYFSRVFKSVSATAPVHYRNLEPAMRREVREQMDLELNESFLAGDPQHRTENGRVPASSGQPINYL
jgi:AraC-like DNA-binding protein